MKSRTFFLFIIFLPAIEIFLFVEIGSMLGSFATIIFTILTALIGIYLLRNGALNQFSSIQSRILQGLSIGENIITAISSAISGILLVIPGFFTDFIGLMLFIEPFRNWIISRVFTIEKFSKSPKKRKNVIDIEKVDDD